jgi:TrmH family RNA methyltransferase
MVSPQATPTETISSSRNPLLRDIRKAVLRGSLTSEGFAVAESFHLLEEALRSECSIKAVLCSTAVRAAVEGHVRGLKRLRLYVVPEKLFQEVSSTENSQGVLTLVQPPVWSLDQLFRGRSMVVILDGLQDPGNAGAILRAAEAFGASGALLIKGTVSPYNPKALRASAGSVFRIPLVTGLDPDIARAALEQKRIDIYAASAKGSRNLTGTDLTRRFALIIGSEGHGVGERLRTAAMDLRIVTCGVESLNAAMAAGIILHEASRQRMIKK